MNSVLPSRPTSCTGTMLACRSCAAARASRKKNSISVGESRPPRGTLSATTRSSSGSRAFQTVPNAPEPRQSTSSKRSIFFGAVCGLATSGRSTRLNALPHEPQLIESYGVLASNSTGLLQCGQRMCSPWACVRYRVSSGDASRLVGGCCGRVDGCDDDDDDDDGGAEDGGAEDDGENGSVSVSVDDDEGDDGDATDGDDDGDGDCGSGSGDGDRGISGDGSGAVSSSAFGRFVCRLRSSW